jgi:hypothetical protein
VSWREATWCDVMWCDAWGEKRDAIAWKCGKGREAWYLERIRKEQGQRWNEIGIDRNKERETGKWLSSFKFQRAIYTRPLDKIPPSKCYSIDRRRKVMHVPRTNRRLFNLRRCIQNAWHNPNLILKWGYALSYVLLVTLKQYLIRSRGNSTIFPAMCLHNPWVFLHSSWSCCTLEQTCQLWV